jgi:TonB family protein
MIPSRKIPLIAIVLSLLLHGVIVFLFIHNKATVHLTFSDQKNNGSALHMHISQQKTIPTKSLENSPLPKNSAKDLIETKQAATPKPIIAGATAQKIKTSDLVFSPKPNYPFLARKKKLEGELEIELIVNQAGIVTELLIRKSSGSPLLDMSAKQTLQSWRFVNSSQTTRKYTKLVQFQLTDI